MNDAAGQPDAVSDDGWYTGVAASVGAGPYALSVTDGGDQRKWEATFTGADRVAVVVKDQPGLELVDAEDVPVAEEAAPPDPMVTPPPQPSEPRQPQPRSESRPVAATPPSTGTVAGWILAMAVVGWAVAGTPRGSGKLPPPVPGTLPSLPGAGLVAVTGDPDAFVGALAGPFRVVLAGRPPVAPVPAGTVFALGPGRVSAEEVAAAARALDGRGPPVVVVVSARLQAPADARESPYDRLARLLPRGVHAYAFGTGAPEYEVGEGGVLRRTS
jgi:hypothetical protein